MTNQEINIAIAEACGWTRVKTVVAYIRPEPFDDWTGPDGYHHGITGPMIPDYPADLNAMHEAEKLRIIGTEHESDYCMYLYENAHQCFATAAQRAEAFLKTLNLWTES